MVSILFTKISHLYKEIILHNKAFEKIDICVGTTDEDLMNCKSRFRIYHHEGYCFDVAEQYIKEAYTYEYTFLTPFDGFKPITVEEALNLVNQLYV